MCTMNISLRRVAAVCAAGLLPLLSAAGATAGGANASPAQQRQIAETTLTSFKVVLTATRVDTGLQATVTAAGYQNSAGHWKLIGQKRIGAAGQWFWYSTEVCGLADGHRTQAVFQLRGALEPLTVSLLMTPALGCSGNVSASWGPASPPPARTTVYVVNRGSSTVTPINAATGTAGTAIGVGRDPVAIAITRTTRPPTSSTTCQGPSRRSAPRPTPPPRLSRSGRTPMPSLSRRTTRPPTSPTPGIGDRHADRRRQRPTPPASRSRRVSTPAPSRSPRTAGPPTSPTTAWKTCRTRPRSRQCGWPPNTAGKPIGLAGAASRLAITANGKTAYVSTGPVRRVVPISTATNTEGKPISIGDYAQAITITPDGRTAYVDEIQPQGVFLVPIRTATNTPRQANQGRARRNQSPSRRTAGPSTRRPARYGDSHSAPPPQRSSARRSRSGRTPEGHRDHPGRQDRCTSPTSDRRPSPRSAPPPTRPARRSRSRPSPRPSQ